MLHASFLFAFFVLCLCQQDSVLVVHGDASNSYLALIDIVNQEVVNLGKTNSASPVWGLTYTKPTTTLFGSTKFLSADKLGRVTLNTCSGAISLSSIVSGTAGTTYSCVTRLRNDPDKLWAVARVDSSGSYWSFVEAAYTNCNIDRNVTAVSFQCSDLTHDAAESVAIAVHYDQLFVLRPTDGQLLKSITVSGTNSLTAVMMSTDDQLVLGDDTGVYSLPAFNAQAISQLPSAMTATKIFNHGLPRYINTGVFVSRSDESCWGTGVIRMNIVEAKTYFGGQSFTTLISNVKGESETYPLPNEKIAFLAVVAANVDSVEFLVEAPNTAAHIQVESGAPLVSHGDDKTALTHVINGANPVAGEYKVTLTPSAGPPKVYRFTFVSPTPNPSPKPMPAPKPTPKPTPKPSPKPASAPEPNAPTEPAPVRAPVSAPVPAPMPLSSAAVSAPATASASVADAATSTTGQIYVSANHVEESNDVPMYVGIGVAACILCVLLLVAFFFLGRRSSQSESQRIVSTPKEWASAHGSDAGDSTRANTAAYVVQPDYGVLPTHTPDSDYKPIDYKANAYVTVPALPETEMSF